MKVSSKTPPSATWDGSLQSGLSMLAVRCKNLFADSSVPLSQEQQLPLIETLEKELQGQEPDFVGISTLISKQRDQLQKFEDWKAAERTDAFSLNHFDWWMFPIDRRSQGQGGKYTVHKPQVEALQRRPVFMKQYRRGVELLLWSWGWDLEQRKPIEGLSFDGHLVRLGKVLDSLYLFGEKNLFDSVQEFARGAVHPGSLTGQLAYLRPWIWPEK